MVGKTGWFGQRNFKAVAGVFTSGPLANTLLSIVFDCHAGVVTLRRLMKSPDFVNDAAQTALSETKAAVKGHRSNARTNWSGQILAAALVLFSSFCGCVGWMLSAIHHLNQTGYVVAFLAGLAVIWMFRKKMLSANFPSWNLRKLRQRFRRAFPLAFLILVALAFLGGALHAPNNFDALSYRTTRVLHWLAEWRWHWIHTEFDQLNTRGCGIEWLTAPLIALTRTDRFDFLINVVCFLLLPGRVFSLFTRLGVRAHVAWYWMWVLPTGYCYLLQAGSVGNDLFGATLAFLALEFALRARQSGQVEHVWLSILAAALMTAAKAFNLLLLLPWLVAAWPSLRLLLRRPLASVLALALGSSISLFPTALINYQHCGDWTGMAAEHRPELTSEAPLFKTWVNIVLIGLQNFAPPIFPLASAWNNLAEHLISPALAANLARYFEPGVRFQLGEMQIEEGAGLGFGVSALLLWVTLARGVRQLRGSWPNPLRSFSQPKTLVPLCAWLALVVFMARNGLDCPARFLAPFYVMLFPPLLACGTSEARLMCGKGCWFAGMGVFLLAGLLLVISPARPLWPAVTVLRALGADQSPHRWVTRVWSVYSNYAGRADAFQVVRAVLPPDATPLGLVAQADPEASLWRPFGSRRILHVCDADSPEITRGRGIKYVLVSSQALIENNISLADWLAKHEGDVVQSLSLQVKVQSGPKEWFLVKLR